MSKTGRICGECGDIGQIENSVASSVCKTACEHTYFAQATAPNQKGIWYCQTCRKKQTVMMENRKSDKAGPTKKFENSKVKFLSSEEVISMSRGTVRQCIKTTTTSIASSIQTAQPSGTPTKTQTSMDKSSSERLLPAKKMLFREPGNASSSERLLPAKKMQFREPGNASSSGYKEMGQSSLKGQLPYRPAPIAWKGSLEVRYSTIGSTLVELVAYLPLQVSAKLYRAIGALPSKLQMQMVSRFSVWPKQLESKFPNLEDIGVYILPSERRFELKCNHLLRLLYSGEHALKMNVNAQLELVVHSSQLLAENSQRIEGDLFFWGFFWKHKMRSGSKKKKSTSYDINPSKTSSEFGASPDFRTPIALDKTVDVVKHNQVDQVVADTLDVSPGFARPSIGQEISPMDKQSATNMRGKEVQPVYKNVAPRCSPLSYIANKESGYFSSIGESVLEDTLEGCENQEEYPEAQYVIHATSEKRADEAESKRMSGQIFIKHEQEPLVPLLGGLDIPPASSRKVKGREEKNVSNQQLETPTGSGILIKNEKEPFALPVGLEIPPGFSRRVEPGVKNNVSNQQQETPPGCGTSGPILIKHENEPFALPVGLEIPPGFSRRVEPREEKNISNQQLETPPGCVTSGPVLIKRENGPFALPVGLEIPPGFSRRDEAREEKNISNECKGSSMNQVLNVPRSVPTKLTDRPLLENQGIVHQQPPAYAVIQGTTSQSCSAQPISPGGIHCNTSMLLFPGSLHRRSIPEVYQVPTSHIQNYLEHSKRTSIMHATGEKQRAHSSYTIPDVKPKAFESPDASFSQMAAQSHNQYYHPFSAPCNGNVPVLSRTPSHFRVFNPSHLASSSRDEYHPSMNNETSDFTATARGEWSPRQIMRRSPVLRQERSRSRSPVRRRHRSRSRRPVQRWHRSRSRSPVRRQERSISRSPVRQERSISRSPVPRRERSRSRSPKRWYGNPEYRRNRSRVRSPVRPDHYHYSGRYSSQYESRYRSRYRGDSGSDSPIYRRYRNRSRSLSPPPSS
ncbi:uncharacterized protein LOC144551136 isoform X2 [Carex rostrata]